MVQKGEYAPQDAFDIIGWFCDDMQDANSTPKEPASVLRKVLELLYKCDNTRFPWRKRMAEVIEKNKRRQEKIVEEAVDEMKDFAADHYYHTSRATRVFQS